MSIALVIVFIFGIHVAGGVSAVVENAQSLPGYLTMHTTYDPVSGTEQPYPIISIVSMIAWGLGYFGMPHILLRFMAIEDEKKLSLSRRVATTWVVISLAVAVMIGVIGLGMTEAGELEMLHGADSETIIVKIADLLSTHGVLPALLGGTILAGILASTMSTADSQLLAASSALLAGEKNAETLLKDALELFDKRFWDEKQGLTYDTWNTEFTVLDDYRGLNANMHTVEAFLAVADAIKEEKYRIRAGRIIDHVIGWASANDWRIPEHFTKEWKADLDCNKECPADRFKPYGATPGHGIEWARLIVQWAYSSYKDTPDSAEVYLKAAEKLYNRAVEDSWNVDGNPGIVYTTDWDGKPVVHDRMHWTLAEAINTSAVLWHITHKQKYAKDYEEFMRYLDDKVLDHKNGSWFHQLDENNNVIGTVWPGKSDVYHAFQSTWIPYGTPYISIASDVKQYMEVCHQ